MLSLGIHAARVQAVHTNRVVEALRATSQFGVLNETSLVNMAVTGKRRVLPRYGVLYREHAVACTFYILLEGTLLQTKAGTALGTAPLASIVVAGGGEAGKSACVCVGTEALSSLPRHATLTAACPCVLLQFAATSVGGFSEFEAFAMARKLFGSFVEQVLRGFSVFRGLPPRTLHAIAPLFEIRELIGGKSVFEEGDAGDAFFILVSGAVAVRKGDLVLATLKAEETRTKLTKELDFDNPFFGEMAILDAAPRMASVRTTEPCKLLLLRADYGEERNGDRFRDFLHLVPDFKARLRETKKTRRQQASLQEKATDAGARAAAEVFHSTGILQRRWRLKAKHTQRGSEVVQPKYCVGTEPERMPSQ